MCVESAPAQQLAYTRIVHGLIGVVNQMTLGDVQQLRAYAMILIGSCVAVDTLVENALVAVFEVESLPVKWQPTLIMAPAIMNLTHTLDHDWPPAATFVQTTGRSLSF